MHKLALTGKSLKKSWTGALKVVTLSFIIVGVHAEEESIIDSAIVTSDCDNAWCYNQDLAIGPSFKSYWYDRIMGDSD